jgi:hypothetical protein
LTLKLEREIWEATHKQGVFCCFEVTIGWFGKERVDYMTYDTKGIFRCYEVKVSKADFHSKASKTFVGHFNYYVMPAELYEKVEAEIPANIGVYVNGCCVKNPKRQQLTVDAQTLKDSLIRSLSREVEKHIKSGNPHIIDRLNQMLNQLEKSANASEKRYSDLYKRVREKYGRHWDDD